MSKTESMTALLKAHDVKISTVKANKILVSLGLLLEKERPSSKYEGKMKKYKALSEAGLMFGLNKENHNSPGQTTPYYYADAFPELLKIIRKS
jgi:hypothetical protein